MEEKQFNIPGQALQPQLVNLSLNKNSWGNVKDKAKLDTAQECWQLLWERNIAPVNLGNLAVKTLELEQQCLPPLSSYYENTGESLLEAAKTASTQGSVLLSPSIYKLLLCSPFLLETWSEADAWLPDFNKKKHPLKFGLILYRLSEIFLAALAIQTQRQNMKLPEDLRSARILLIRQRFRFLAGLSIYLKEDNSELIEYLPGFPLIVRNAQREYARLILEQADEVELALQLATPPKDGWDLDQEVNMVLFSDKPCRLLWSFARETHSDLLFTDTLIRTWMLPHDNLRDATACLTSLIQSDTTHKLLINGFSRLILSLRMLLSLGAVCFVLYLFFQDKILNITPPIVHLLIQAFKSLSAIICGIGTVGVVFLVSSKKIIIRQKTYPLALRIPAMGLVGLLVSAEFIEKLDKLVSNSFDNAGFFLVFLSAVSLSFAFLYITSEISARLRFSKSQGIRAWDLFSYGWASSFWLSTLVFFIYWRFSHPDFLLMDFLFHPHLWLILLALSSASLLVGVFTQIFWEDKAIAEPL